MTQSQQKMNGISIIRTFAMITIMLYHIGYGHYYFTQLKLSAAVHLFFCISAFLIMYTTETKTPASFLKRRLIRIVPLYFLLTVFTFIASKFISGFGQDNIGIPELIKSILFIPYSRSGLKSDVAVRPIVGPAWTLYYDVWFAVLFFIAMKLTHKHRGLVAAITCAVLYIVGMFLPKELPIAVLVNNGYLLSFITGIVVFYIWNKILKNKSAAFPLLWGIVAAFLLICFYLMPRIALLQTTVAGLILLCTLTATKQKSVPKIFTHFSTVSFSFYLLHYYVILIAGKVIDFTKINIITVLGTFAVFAVTLVISFFSYIIIEKKLGNALNKFSIRRGT